MAARPEGDPRRGDDVFDISSQVRAESRAMRAQVTTTDATYKGHQKGFKEFCEREKVRYELSA